ncbi:hypothetical protein [Bradyrhizobium sp. 199]|nr:hypothetical protein [Bradyrhizobium sp. 199]
MKPSIAALHAGARDPGTVNRQRETVLGALHGLLSAERELQD